MAQVAEEVAEKFLEFKIEGMGPRLRTSFAERAFRIARDNNIPRMELKECATGAYTTDYTFKLQCDPTVFAKYKAEIEAIVERENVA